MRNNVATYSDEKIKNNWTALLLMADLFGEFAKQISVTLNFNYNINEEQNVKKYLKTMYDRQK